ncbi:hypothetical protein ACE103_30175 [Bradyrhizobium sp. ma5]|uniref:hypothetical protein n=1 Tax=Bradyrhizobium sp. ma5 TaxID=3344828 RepID=UPI0035D488A5
MPGKYVVEPDFARKISSIATAAFAEHGRRGTKSLHRKLAWLERTSHGQEATLTTEIF